MNGDSQEPYQFGPRSEFQPGRSERPNDDDLIAVGRDGETNRTVHFRIGDWQEIRQLPPTGPGELPKIVLRRVDGAQGSIIVPFDYRETARQLQAESTESQDQALEVEQPTEVLRKEIASDIGSQAHQTSQQEGGVQAPRGIEPQTVEVEPTPTDQAITAFKREAYDFSQHALYSEDVEASNPILLERTFNSTNMAFDQLVVNNLASREALASRARALKDRIQKIKEIVESTIQGAQTLFEHEATQALYELVNPSVEQQSRLAALTAAIGEIKNQMRQFETSGKTDIENLVMDSTSLVSKLGTDKALLSPFLDSIGAIVPHLSQSLRALQAAITKLYELVKDEAPDDAAAEAQSMRATGVQQPPQSSQVQPSTREEDLGEPSRWFRPLDQTHWDPSKGRPKSDNQ